jgi:hypothetical protein
MANGKWQMAKGPMANAMPAFWLGLIHLAFGICHLAFAGVSVL